jgi:amidase
MVAESKSGTLNDYQYTAVRDHGCRWCGRRSRDPHGRKARRDRLSNGVTRTPLICRARRSPGGRRDRVRTSRTCPGFPDLIVPAGFTTDNLPVAMSFLGRRSASRGSWRSAQLRAGDQGARLPVQHPLRPGDAIAVP